MSHNESDFSDVEFDTNWSESEISEDDDDNGSCDEISENDSHLICEEGEGSDEDHCDGM
jgi:hypothetical protein